MQLLKTDKETLTTKEIEKYIEDHQGNVVPTLDKLWQYFKAKNTAILKRRPVDDNNPDNRTPVGYGRKIITTYTGYAFRPRYTSYKVSDESKDEYMQQLQATFDMCKEHIKTSRAGRNSAIFGVAYEMLYIDNSVDRATTLETDADPRFFEVDPREMILLYDHAPEPNKKIAIRYYKIDEELWKVEVYYDDRVELYDRKIEKGAAAIGSTGWKLVPTGTAPNFFDEIPVIAYYFGDDMLGLIEPVLPLIDDYDILVSDSISEFSRFAHAYLLMVKMGLVPPELKKEPGAISRMLHRLKQLRVFENLPDKDAVSFLTKDIPKDFIEYMTTTLREQIHEQSHVPDFSNMKTGELSGAAIERLMFDFENVVSSAEADFETGLIERIRLMNVIYKKSGKLYDEDESVVIMRKRNMPLNLAEFADTAVKLKQAGFSRRMIADAMPDDIVPDVDAELEEQDNDAQALMPDLDAMMRNDMSDADTT